MYRAVFATPASFGENSRFSDLYYIFQEHILQWAHVLLYVGYVWGAVGSTSPSGGNQVDGLPPVSHTGAVSASWSPKKC